MNATTNTRVSRALMLTQIILLALTIPISAMAIQVSPEEMLVGTTFNGKDVDVTGKIAADEEAVVQIIGNSSEADFKRTGKVGGLFWMTVAHLSIDDAPSAYFVYLPKAVSSLRQSKDEQWFNLKLDFDSLLPQIKIVPEPEDKENVFNDFLIIKRRMMAYIKLSITG